MPIKFIDLFCGIWGFRKAFTSLWAECVFSSDWDKYAQITYEANYWEKPWGDIMDINAKDIPDHDILTWGFPCQPFSIAGVSSKNFLWRKHGFDDEKQGHLFFRIAEIIQTKKPKAFFLENVKNLISHDKGNTFKVISSTLQALGYNIYCKVIDGKYYVPQHRERIFIIGFRNEHFPEWNPFNFPEYPEQRSFWLKDILDKEVDKKYYLTDNMRKYLQERKEQQQQKGNGFWFGLVDPQVDTYTRTLSARYYKDWAEILIKTDKHVPRRLTPTECARLMWFWEDFKIVVSDMQAYKQFWNSVIVPAIEATAKEVVKYIKTNWKTIKQTTKKTKKISPMANIESTFSGKKISLFV